MEIVDSAIEQFILNTYGKRDSVLLEMEGYAQERDFPIVGPLVGRLLCQLARLNQAKRILELGSGFGYSAYWFAQALDEDGEIVLTDLNQENLTYAERYLNRGGLRPRFRFLQGNGLDTLDEIDGEFDIIFNDVDKHLYPHVFKKAAPRLRAGGLLITDNVLWGGKVLTSSPSDEDTKGIVQYNWLIFAHPEFFSTILPIRDGVAVSLKRS